MTVVKNLFLFMPPTHWWLQRSPEEFKLRVAQFYTYNSFRCKSKWYHSYRIYSMALNSAFAWFIGRQARKNKVTIGSIEAFMKHMFRAVDRFRIVIFTLHAIDGEVRIRAFLRWRKRMACRSCRDIWIGFVFLSTEGMSRKRTVFLCEDLSSKIPNLKVYFYLAIRQISTARYLRSCNSGSLLLTFEQIGNTARKIQGNINEISRW